jgi:hypothetical protein
MDLPRFCAALLITYCAAKEMSHEHMQVRMNFAKKRCG